MQTKAVVPYRCATNAFGGWPVPYTFTGVWSCMNKSMGPDIITNTGVYTRAYAEACTHTYSQPGLETMELLRGFHLWLDGKAPNTIRS